MDNTVEIEITVAEGGTWLKMRITPELLCEWLSILYNQPRLDAYTPVYAIRLIVGGGSIVRDYALTNNPWRAE